MAKLAEVKAAQDEIGNSSGKMSESMSKDAGEAGKAVDGLGKEVDKTGTGIDDSMKKSSKSVSDFDRLITSAMKNDGKAVNVFTFVCSDLNQLKGVMRALQKVQGVVAVERA